VTSKPKARETEPAAPPGLPVLDTEEFRRRLAGLADPLGPRAGAAGRENLKQVSARLCAIMAHLYAVDDDRTKIWQHIGKALITALERTSDDDVEHFLTIALDSINSDHGRAASCDALTKLSCEIAAWPAEQRHDFLNYTKSHIYAVLTFGRQRWEQVKKKELEL
jgi:hypothetical protein